MEPMELLLTLEYIVFADFVCSMVRNNHDKNDECSVQFNYYVVTWEIPTALKTFLTFWKPTEKLLILKYPPFRITAGLDRF